jgi:phosphoribosyl-AMP cyclohydrolase
MMFEGKSVMVTFIDGEGEEKDDVILFQRPNIQHVKERIRREFKYKGDISLLVRNYDVKDISVECDEDLMICWKEELSQLRATCIQQRYVEFFEFELPKYDERTSGQRNILVQT